MGRLPYAHAAGVPAFPSGRFNNMMQQSQQRMQVGQQPGLNDLSWDNDIPYVNPQPSTDANRPNVAAPSPAPIADQYQPCELYPNYSISLFYSIAYVLTRNKHTFYPKLILIA